MTKYTGYEVRSNFKCLLLIGHGLWTIICLTLNFIISNIVNNSFHRIVGRIMYNRMYVCLVVYYCSYCCTWISVAKEDKLSSIMKKLTFKINCVSTNSPSSYFYLCPILLLIFLCNYRRKQQLRTYITWCYKKRLPKVVFYSLPWPHSRTSLLGELDLDSLQHRFCSRTLLNFSSVRVGWDYSLPPNEMH